MTAHRHLSPIDRLIAGFLLVLLTLGTFVLWIGVPAGALWGLSQLSESRTYHFVVGLISVPIGMILFTPVLLWLNGLYLRVTGHWGYDEEEQRPTRLRGPLEPLLVWSFLIAITCLFIWFFFMAENPSMQVI